MFSRFSFLVCDVLAEYWILACVFFCRARTYEQFTTNVVASTLETRYFLLRLLIVFRVLLFLFGLVFLKYNTSIGKI